MGEFLRKYATPMSLVAFGAAGITGVLMFLGIRNHEFNELHEWFGVAFVVIGVLHLFRNGKGFAMMVRQWRSIIIIVLFGGAAAIVAGAALAEKEEGGNPFRAQAMVAQEVAKAPISDIAPLLGLKDIDAVARLRQAGLTVEGPGQSLADVARKNEKPTPQLYAVLLGDRNAAPEHD